MITMAFGAQLAIAVCGPSVLMAPLPRFATEPQTSIESYCMLVES